jgi:hypothetical protein
MTGEKSACCFYNCTENGKPDENISLIFSYMHQNGKAPGEKLACFLNEKTILLFHRS